MIPQCSMFCTLHRVGHTSLDPTALYVLWPSQGRTYLLLLIPQCSLFCALHTVECILPFIPVLYPEDFLRVQCSDLFPTIVRSSNVEWGFCRVRMVLEQEGTTEFIICHTCRFVAPKVFSRGGLDLASEFLAFIKRDFSPLGDAGSIVVATWRTQTRTSIQTDRQIHANTHAYIYGHRHGHLRMHIQPQTQAKPRHTPGTCAHIHSSSSSSTTTTTINNKNNSTHIRIDTQAQTHTR